MEITFAARLNPLTLSRVVNIAGFTLLITLGAKVYIPLPFTPVPITLQTFFVVLSGAFLGLSDGLASSLLYVFLGVAGLPVFSANNAGPAVFLGPTGGYLVGFIFASAFIGSALSRPASRASRDCFPGISRSDCPAPTNITGFVSLFSLFMAAHFLIYFFGTLNLILLFNYSIPEVIQKGVIPFLPGDILKAAMAPLVFKKFALLRTE